MPGHVRTTQCILVKHYATTHAEHFLRTLDTGSYHLLAFDSLGNNFTDFVGFEVYTYKAVSSS